MEIENSADGMCNVTSDFGHNDRYQETDYDEDIHSIPSRHQSQKRTEGTSGIKSGSISTLDIGENKNSRNPSHISILKSDHVISERVTQLGFTAHVSHDTDKFDSEWIQSCKRLADTAQSTKNENDLNPYGQASESSDVTEAHASDVFVPFYCECGKQITDISKLSKLSGLKDNKNFPLKTSNVAITKEDIVQDLLCICGLRKTTRQQNNKELGLEGVRTPENSDVEISSKKNYDIILKRKLRNRVRDTSESEGSEHEYDHTSGGNVTSDWLTKNVTCDERESNMIAPTSF